MLRLIAAALICLISAAPIVAAESAIGVPTPPKADTTVTNGLELPADQNVSFDEGYVTIQAKCKGDVRWLVVSNAKIKYMPVGSNAIVLSIPPSGNTVISVFAVGLVDGKMTDFVRTNVTVGPPTPGPAPTPTPTPNPNPNPPTPVPNPPKPAGQLHVTFLVDMNSVTPAVAQLLNSESLRKTINSKGYWFRLYDIKSDVVAKKKLDKVIAGKGNMIMVVQADDGTVLWANPIPATEQDIYNVISQVSGGR